MNRRLTALGRGLLGAVAVAQAVAGLRVVSRLLRTRDGIAIDQVRDWIDTGERVGVLLPVLNEVDRLAPCLDALCLQGSELAEILVIDGNSTDGTRELVAQYAEFDCRVRLLTAPPSPAGTNGKAQQLQYGFDYCDWNSEWLLTIDADVRPHRFLTRSLIAHAHKTGVPAFSVATRQDLRGPFNLAMHASMLTTLVYRFGIPGQATQRVNEVQANGQCFLIRFDLLEATGGFADLEHSLNEDVSLARRLAKRGVPVGFYEAGDLVKTEMYADWRETWRNWPRSLPMRDRLAPWSSLVGLAEVTLAQSLPFWVTLAGRGSLGKRHPLVLLNTGLLAMRIGVLAGTSRAYTTRPLTYWLSPVLDLPVVIRLWQSALTRTHQWRGRPLQREA